MIEYKSFKEARNFSRKLGIKSASKWREYSFSSKRPLDIPSHPDRQYKNNGWVSWMDWLNTDNKQCGSRKYVVNDDYFKKWSSDMAYILGFWFTDGYMHEKLGTFSITQHYQDKYLLEDILKRMESNYPLAHHGDNNWVFKITSHEIIRDIKKYGGHQRKSHNIEFPKMIPKKYLPDFIRGLWDGDGSVCYQKNEKCYVSSFVSASKTFIYNLLDILRIEIPSFKGTIHLYNCSYIISVGVNDTRRLRDYIYKNITDNSLFLKRKYEKFIGGGLIKIASFNLEFLNYGDAQKFVREKGIKKYKEWRKYKKDHNVVNIPANCEVIYKDKGWIDWETFVGTKFWNYIDAKKYVNSLGLKTANEWKQYAASDKRIDNIPSNPWQVYKEWKGLKPWLSRN